MVYHRKVLMSVAGLIWHQIEVKNDRNHPTLLGWFWSPNITQNSALYCIKFSQYNQQGSLITCCKFFNKYFTFPLNATWGLEEHFSIFPTYSSYTDVTQNFEPLRWRRISPCHTNFKTHYSVHVLSFPVDFQDQIFIYVIDSWTFEWVTTQCAVWIFATYMEWL